MEKMIGEYREGRLSKAEVMKKFSDWVAPLFTMTHLMSGLDMKWVVDGEGIIAYLGVWVDCLKDKIEVKLRLNDTDVAQIPYGYLVSGRMPESEEINIFFNLLGGSKQSTFIDIGANIGWYSILASYVGAKVYCFEPIQNNYQRLCENIELNGSSMIKPFNMGLGEKEGTEDFYFYNMASGASSRVNLNHWTEKYSKPQKMRCNIDTLDHICAQEEIDQIDLIKCDVEGSELFVFKGGVETIKRFRPFVLSEMLRKWSAKFNYHPNDIIKFFADLDYECIALDRMQNGKGYLIREVLEKTEETNFLFFPAEKAQMVQTLITVTGE